ncbi:MAG: hypothetical protein AUI14_06400 [Actinobacteria bacterium 13_2_20CM_2_71_6]|nr:MAG: hypothetical protein AUI14_06400 [Actinobacteria bacterium 13_2_20CM_2_71_6]
MTLVLLLSGSTMAGLPDIVRAARHHCVRVTAVAGNEATARVRAFLSTLDGVALVPDPYDPEVVAAGAREVAGGVPGTVLARDDAVSAVAARASELLGAHASPKRSAFRLSSNPSTVRRATASAGSRRSPSWPAPTAS